MKINNNDFSIFVKDIKQKILSAEYSVRIQNRDDVQAHLKEQGIPTAELVSDEIEYIMENL